MTTTAQLADMLQQAEKDRRRERVMLKVGPGQRGTRIESRKNRPGKGGKGADKRRAIREF